MAVSNKSPDLKPAAEKALSELESAKVTLAKLLAGNNKKIRDKGLKKLRNWLTLRSQGNFSFAEEDLMTFWTGLYYSMWMSDLPLVQEDLAESISSLIHCFNKNTDGALLFIKCFAVTINEGWATLDQHRLDKFAMFTRRFLRQSLLWLANQTWALQQVKQLMKIYSIHVLGEKVTLGFKFHFIEIFLEELAKTSKGELPHDVLVAILQPFVRTAALTTDGRVRMQCEAFFRQMIKQTDVAFKFNEKFEAWKRAGFPGGNVNVMAEVDEGNDSGVDDGDIDEEVEEGVADPRAGSCDVILPQLKFPSKRLAKLMKKTSALPQASVKGKKLMLALCRRFKQLDKGKYPYAFGKVCDDERLNIKKLVAQTAKREVNAELKRQQKKKNRKLRKKTLNGSTESPTASPKYLATKKKKEITPKKKAAKTRDQGKVKKRSSLNFIVTATEENEERSPVGAKKRKSSGKPELDLPSGWIVENCEDTPSKRRAVEDASGGVRAEKVENSDSVTPGECSSVSTPKRSRESKKVAQVETEVIVGERKNTTPPKIPAFFAHAYAKVNPKTPVASPAAKLAKETLEAAGLSKSGRRISFNLAKNMAQEKVEWFEQIQRSPQIPFDSASCPRRSALKQGLPPSPINPFYAMKLGLYNKQ